MSAPLRIAHLVAPAPVGGLETVVRHLARGQRARGHDVRVALVLESDDPAHPFLASLRAEGLTVEVLAVPPRGYLRERREVGRFLRAARSQVLHTHGYRPDVVDAGVARRLEIPTVTTVHGFTGGSWRNRLYERLQCRAFRRFGAVVAVSRPLAAHLGAQGVPLPKLHVVPNVLAPARDLLGREAARRELGLPADARLVGWVGRVSREKGADTFVDALLSIADRRWQAVFVGDGPERQHLEQRVREAGQSGTVHWLGRVSDAGRLFRAFDVFVLSSRTEGTPMSLLEAIAARVPAVVTEVGGVPDVVSSQEAWVVDADRPAALARAVQEAVERPEEASRRAAAAHARTSQERSVETWLDQYDSIYRSLL